jgi:ankyrin repeat protein
LLVNRGREYRVHHTVLLCLSGVVNAQHRSAPDMTTFEVDVDVSDDLFARFASVLNFNEEPITPAELAQLPAITAALAFRPMPFPPDPMGLSTDYKLSISEDGLHSLLRNCPAFRIATKGGFYNVPTLSAALSPVLAARLPDRRFDYDFDDQTGDFRPAANFLNGATLDLTGFHVDDLNRIATDLSISQLRGPTAEFIADWARREPIIEKHQVDVCLVIDLQKTLDDVNLTNFGGIAAELLKSDWFAREDLIGEFVSNLFVIAQKHLRKAPGLASLVSAICDSKAGRFLQPFLSKRLLCALDQEYLLPFAVALTERGVIEANTITGAIYANVLNSAAAFSQNLAGTADSRKCATDNANQQPRLLPPVADRPVAYFWFLPELLARFPALRMSPPDLRASLSHFWLHRTGLKLRHGDMVHLVEDDWRQFREERAHGRSTDSMSVAIDADDVDAFQASFVRLDVDPNLLIYGTPFAIGLQAVLHCVPSRKPPEPGVPVLVYAAWRGAIRIVKHLLINGATVTMDVGAAAIASGCPEIVRLIDDTASGPFNHTPYPQGLFKGPFAARDAFGGPDYHARSWLYFALSFAQTAIFRWLFESKLMNPETFFTDRDTPLPSIAASNNLEALLLFFDVQANVNRICAPLVREISNGHVTMLKLIADLAPETIVRELKSPSPVRDYTSAKPRFPLVSAVATGDLAVVEFVWDAMPAIVADHVFNAIRAAFECGFRDVADFLIARFDWTNPKFPVRTLLKEGAARGFPEVAELLLPRMDDSSDVRDMILRATVSGNSELAKFWMNLQQQRKRLRLDDIAVRAIRTGDLEIARLVGRPSLRLAASFVSTACKIDFLPGVEYGFGFLSDPQRQPLLESCASGVFPAPIDRFFLRQLPDDHAAFLKAAKIGDIDRVKRILQMNDFVNTVAEEGNALCLAAQARNEELVRYLLSLPNIDPMIRTLNGDTPFVLACQFARRSMWSLIADACGDALCANEVNAGLVAAVLRDELDADFEVLPFFLRFSPVIDPNLHFRGSSPFLASCGRSTTSLLKWMLTFSEVNVNDRSSTGETGAMVAARLGRVKVMRLLLRNPAVDFELVDENGDSALSAACRAGHSGAMHPLLASGRIDVKKFGARALSAAIANKHEHTFRALLAHPDITVNPPFRDGFDTPLVAAVRQKREIGDIMDHPTFDRKLSDATGASSSACKTTTAPPFQPSSMSTCAT